jgi:23S rRNA pseudouridine1911/1915/1917 synthase
MMEEKIIIRVEPDNAKLRIDKFLSKNFKRFSRSLFQKLIIDGKIKVNGMPILNNYKLKTNDEIVVEMPAKKRNKAPGKSKIPIDVVYENDDIAVINKQAGLVVHPSDQGQNIDKSLVNGLLYKYGKENLSDFGGKLRPGIVHRLDKETSGLMIIAKTNKIHEYLVDLMKKREIEKKYTALLVGHLNDTRGLIDSPLKKSNTAWGKVVLASEHEGREAKTKYEVKEYFDSDGYKFTLIEAQILTGRTHQIRVHFSSIGYPVAGDFLYGNKKVNDFCANALNLKRQFLHSTQIKFKLPDGEIIDIKKGLPPDLEEILNKLR